MQETTQRADHSALWWHTKLIQLIHSFSGCQNILCPVSKGTSKDSSPPCIHSELSVLHYPILKKPVQWILPNHTIYERPNWNPCIQLSWMKAFHVAFMAPLIDHIYNLFRIVLFDSNMFIMFCVHCMNNHWVMVERYKTFKFSHRCRNIVFYFTSCKQTKAKT